MVMSYQFVPHDRIHRGSNYAPILRPSIDNIEYASYLLHYTFTRVYHGIAAIDLIWKGERNDEAKSDGTMYALPPLIAACCVSVTYDNERALQTFIADLIRIGGASIVNNMIYNGRISPLVAILTNILGDTTTNALAGGDNHTSYELHQRHRLYVMRLLFAHNQLQLVPSSSLSYQHQHDSGKASMSVMISTLIGSRYTCIDTLRLYIDYCNRLLLSIINASSSSSSSVSSSTPISTSTSTNMMITHRSNKNESFDIEDYSDWLSYGLSRVIQPHHHSYDINEQMANILVGAGASVTSAMTRILCQTDGGLCSLSEKERRRWIYWAATFGWLPSIPSLRLRDARSYWTSKTDTLHLPSTPIDKSTHKHIQRLRMGGIPSIDYHIWSSGYEWYQTRHYRRQQFFNDTDAVRILPTVLITIIDEYARVPHPFHALDHTDTHSSGGGGGGGTTLLERLAGQRLASKAPSSSSSSTPLVSSNPPTIPAAAATAASIAASVPVPVLVGCNERCVYQQSNTSTVTRIPDMIRIMIHGAYITVVTNYRSSPQSTLQPSSSSPSASIRFMMPLPSTVAGTTGGTNDEKITPTPTPTAIPSSWTFETSTAPPPLSSPSVPPIHYGWKASSLPSTNSDSKSSSLPVSLPLPGMIPNIEWFRGVLSHAWKLLEIAPGCPHHHLQLFISPVQPSGLMSDITRMCFESFGVLSLMIRPISFIVGHQTVVEVNDTFATIVEYRGGRPITDCYAIVPLIYGIDTYRYHFKHMYSHWSRSIRRAGSYHQPSSVWYALEKNEPVLTLSANAITRLWTAIRNVRLYSRVSGRVECVRGLSAPMAAAARGGSGVIFVSTVGVLHPATKRTLDHHHDNVITFDESLSLYPLPSQPSSTSSAPLWNNVCRMREYYQQDRDKEEKSLANGSGRLGMSCWTRDQMNNPPNKWQHPVSRRKALHIPSHQRTDAVWITIATPTMTTTSSVSSTNTSNSNTHSNSDEKKRTSLPSSATATAAVVSRAMISPEGFQRCVRSATTLLLTRLPIVYDNFYDGHQQHAYGGRLHNTAPLQYNIIESTALRRDYEHCGADTIAASYYQPFLCTTSNNDNSNNSVRRYYSGSGAYHKRYRDHLAPDVRCHITRLYHIPGM